MFCKQVASGYGNTYAYCYSLIRFLYFQGFIIWSIKFHYGTSFYIQYSSSLDLYLAVCNIKKLLFYGAVFFFLIYHQCPGRVVVNRLLKEIYAQLSWLIGWESLVKCWFWAHVDRGIHDFSIIFWVVWWPLFDALLKIFFYHLYYWLLLYLSDFFFPLSGCIFVSLPINLRCLSFAVWRAEGSGCNRANITGCLSRSCPCLSCKYY